MSLLAKAVSRRAEMRRIIKSWLEYNVTAYMHNAIESRRRIMEESIGTEIELSGI
jgi:hypothetical protein